MHKTFALLSALACLLVFPGTALAVFDQMPSQDWMDNTPPDSSMTSGTWSDMPDGAAVRPYIKSLSVINDGHSEPVFAGDASAAAAVPVGDVTATISPINLCKAGQDPQANTCYSTPNRIGLVFGYRTLQGIGTDFSNTHGVELRQHVDANTTFDVTIGLNTLGQPLRWTWLNGDLVDWKTVGLGTAAGEVDLRVQPAVTPDIDWSNVGPNGCTATPIFDCRIAQASGSFLGANAVFSIDDTLDPSLAGAAFATQGAIAGFLVPGGSPSEPVLDLQMASAHLAADGTPQHGVLQAFLPEQALVNSYGLLPTDAASFFTATREGDPGTQDPPEFDARSASDTSDSGLFVTIRNVTFSAPTYRLARKRSSVRIGVSNAHGATRVATGRLRACRHGACRLVVYRISASGRAVQIASARSDRLGVSLAKASRAKLGRGVKFIAALRRGGKLLAATRGVAH